MKSTSKRILVSTFSLGALLAAAARPAFADRPAPRSRATGTISGEVVFEYASPRGSEPFADMVVYLTGFADPAGQAADPSRPTQIIQKDTRFTPRVLPVLRGQSVSFRNEDAILHNVFSVSEARAFDLGLTRAPSTTQVGFPEVGVVEIYCNIHPEMAATILVLPNRSFTRVDGKGRFELRGVPVGNWMLHLWDPNSDPLSQELAVRAGETAAPKLRVKNSRAPTPHLNKFGRPYKDSKKY